MTKTEIAKLHDAVAGYIERHPEKTFQLMADELGMSLPSISLIAAKYKLNRRERHKKNFDPATVLAKITADTQ